MSSPRNRRQRRGVSLSVDSLEGRTVMSTGAAGLLAGLNLPPAWRSLLGSGALNGRVKVDPVAVGVIRDALMGRGPAADFGPLVRSQLRNLPTIVNSFIRGGRSEYTAPGIAVKLPRWQDAYTGPHNDHLTATAAGAVLQRNGSLQLGAVMRGLFDEPTTSQVVFGLDRGAGGSVGPVFAERSAITPDLVVTITVGPNGTNPTGTILDRTTGTTTTIDPARIRVVGATVRVTLDASQIPSKGQPASRFRFAAWTRFGETGGIESVGSFVPERTMVRVGVAPRGR